MIVMVTEETESPVVYWFRWVGHACTVRAVWRDAEVRFVAFDVIAALGQDTSQYATDPGANARATREQIAHATSWDLALLEQVVTALDTPDALELLTWASARARDMAAREGSRTVARGNVTAGPWLAPVSLPAHTDPWYSVAQAARILSRDPAIDATQKSLFEWLHAAGWIDRPTTAWEPNRDAIALGFLLLVPRRGVPGYPKGTPYPQVGITPLGLHKLHERLGGTAELDLTRHHLTLTEEGPDDQPAPHS